MADKKSAFVTRVQVSGDDPREFGFDGNKYQVGLDKDGNPNGFSYFGGAAPTFIGAAKMQSICKPEFLTAAENAASKAVEAVKAGKLVYRDHTGRNGKTSKRWQAPQASA